MATTVATYRCVTAKLVQAYSTESVWREGRMEGKRREGEEGRERDRGI